MAQVAANNPSTVFDLPLAGRSLSGFLLTGLLFALVGALLPAWGYHLESDFVSVGNYFLSLALGVISAGLLRRWILQRSGLGRLLPLACALLAVSLIYLAAMSPPVRAEWRLPGMYTAGFAAALLNSGLLYAISPAYRSSPAATIAAGGVFFGIGSVASALLVSATFYVYTPRGILLLGSAIPAAFGFWFGLSQWPALRLADEPSLARTAREFRSLPAVLLALLLFFQFGNEWALAGWLPLFLIRRLGISPESSLTLTALYWIALLLGRLVALLLLPAVRHSRLLLAGALAAQFGCVILTFTNNRFGAIAGILFIGAGFATIYPLVAEKIGALFPYYHPGFFNGIFSFGLMGGLLAPASIGYIADTAGISAVMAVPFLGTAMVTLIVLLIWLEARISG